METIAQLHDNEVSLIAGPSKQASELLHLFKLNLARIAITAFSQLLEPQRAKLLSLPKKTYQYGPTERHQVPFPSFDRCPVDSEY